MRSEDRILQGITIIGIINSIFILLGFFVKLDLFRNQNILLLIVGFNLFMGIIIILYYFSLQKERTVIMKEITQLKENGMVIRLRHYEKLLYSRDIADLPRITYILFNHDPLAIFQPKDLSEIKKILKICNQFKIPLIPRATSTSGYGGTIPVKGGIILDLTEFNKVIRFDAVNKEIEVETGIRWKNLLQFLETRNFTLLNYPSSSPSATVGGWITQGGYGIGSSRYGSVKKAVNELKFISSNGEEVVLQDSEPYIGSCGTLGILYTVTLKIIPIFSIELFALSSKDKDSIIKAIPEFQQLSPYYLKFFDSLNIEWNRQTYPDYDKCFPPEKDKYAGIVMITFSDGENHQKTILEIAKRYKLALCGSQIAQLLWDERFYTLRVKRRGPSLITAEVLIPNTSLNSFYSILEKRFPSKSYATEVLSSSDEILTVLIWFPVDERKFEVPFIGSLSYLFRWFRTFEVIQIARKIGGTPYSTGLWLSAYTPEIMGLKNFKKMKEMKNKYDIQEIMNPGKVYGIYFPRFLPVISLSFAIKAIIPFLSLLYRIIPRKYR